MLPEERVVIEGVEGDAVGTIFLGGRGGAGLGGLRRGGGGDGLRRGGGDGLGVGWGLRRKGGGEERMLAKGWGRE